MCRAFFHQPDLFTCIGCGGTCNGVDVLNGSTCFVQDDMACPRSWKQHRLCCYFFSSDKKSWTNALEACREKGGDLVEVNDVKEHNFLISTAPYLFLDGVEGYWIGLTDKERNDTFVWISSGQIPSFTMWSPTEPSHRWEDFDEDCAFYNATDYKRVWNDVSCEEELNYICERRQGVC
ncbi:perlucin-like protein [Mercenaria mercenaria]|uniref:perlucin-like protein n=1 Tax=Mercenaria mercenaria TaxID=6596 RepID=UPI00234E38E8|nr:perlucin-like protein [Mercenaria mercenaria]